MSAVEFATAGPSLARKRSVTVKVMQFDGSFESGRRIEIWAATTGVKIEQVPPQVERIDGSNETREVAPRRLVIPTLEGEMYADATDVIIRGVDGEFYPCKLSIFAKTYESPDSVADDDEVGSTVIVHNHVTRPRLLIAGAALLAASLVVQLAIGIYVLVARP